MASTRISSARLLAAIVREVGIDEIGLTVALLLLAEGARQVWPPAAYLAPALVLLWIFLPQRKGFVYRTPPPQKGKE